MALPTLATIITKVRKLTGSGNSFQLTDSMIQDYINSYYYYDLPAQFRSLKLKDKYTFDTIQGVDTYAFDSEHYTTVEMPCYCAKREIKLFQDPWSFYGVNFNWQQQEYFANGSGIFGPYTGFAQATPLIGSVNNDPSDPNYPAGRVQNILITVNTATSTINVTDIPQVGNTGIGDLYLSTDITATTIGTINYQTGAISVTFPVVIPVGTQIQIQYNPVVLSIPLSIMFFQNQFTLRPVPDAGYTIELVAYRQPTQALLTNSTTTEDGQPELSEWWELLAAGAAKKIYEDRLDADGVALMDKLLKERYDVAMDRTYAQIGTQRISTLFADQLSYNYGQGSGFF